MAVNPPPIQEKTSDELGRFPRVWLRWFKEIRDKISALEEAVLTTSLTTFGETVVAQNEPFVQGSAIYGFIPSNFREFTATGGSTGAENRLFKVSTGTSIGGYGAIQSFRAVNAKNGQSTLARFTG